MVSWRHSRGDTMIRSSLSTFEKISLFRSSMAIISKLIGYFLESPLCFMALGQSRDMCTTKIRIVGVIQTSTSTFLFLWTLVSKLTISLLWLIASLFLYYFWLSTTFPSFEILTTQPLFMQKIKDQKC